MAPCARGLSTSLAASEAARAYHRARLEVTVQEAGDTPSGAFAAHTFIEDIASATGVATERALSSTFTAHTPKHATDTRESMVLHTRRGGQHAQRDRRTIAGGGEAAEGKGSELHLPSRNPAGPAPDNVMGGRRVLPSVLHALQHGGGEARHTSLCKFRDPRV